MRMLIVGLLVFGCGADPNAAEINSSDAGKLLTFARNQEVDLTLQTIGGGQYGEPEVSSPAVRFEGMSFPAVQNPGGPTQIYQFRAITQGSAVVTIPHSIAGREPFIVTLSCCTQ